MNKIVAVLGLLTIFGRTGLSAQSWGYGDAANGPANWGDNFPICNDNQQSPIDIVTQEAEINYDLAQFQRDVTSPLPSGMRIFNNGHTVQVNLDGGYTINIPGFLDGTFRAAQFHLHWGGPSENDAGSEHTLNGGQYFGELHIVHYNTIYPSLGRAANESDGLAVLGFFIEDDYPQDNLAFGRFLNLIMNGSVSYDNGSFEYDQRYSVETLLPPCLDTYYRYQTYFYFRLVKPCQLGIGLGPKGQLNELKRGSLTTPPCYESVTWTVFDSIIQISRAQAAILEGMVYENLQGADDNIALVGNFRPPQPLNGRTVTRSPPCDRSSSAALKPLFLLIALLAMICSTLFCQ